MHCTKEKKEVWLISIGWSQWLVAHVVAFNGSSPYIVEDFMFRAGMKNTLGWDSENNLHICHKLVTACGWIYSTCTTKIQTSKRGWIYIWFLWEWRLAPNFYLNFFPVIAHFAPWQRKLENNLASNALETENLKHQLGNQIMIFE